MSASAGYVRNKGLGRPWRVTVVLVLFSAIVLAVSFARTRLGDVSASHLQSLAVWKDDGAQASVTQARLQNYTPYEGGITRGYSNAAYWIRVHVTPHPEPLVLKVTPPWLDEVDLYLGEENMPQARLGDTMPRQNAQPTTLGTATILPPSSDPTTLWVRARSGTTAVISLQLRRFEDDMRLTVRQALLIAAHQTGLIALVVIALVVWIWHPDPLLPAFATQQAVFLIYVTGFEGLPALFLQDSLPQGLLERSHWLSTFAVVATFIGFESYFLQRLRAPAWTLWVLRAMCFAVVLLPLMAMLPGLGAVSLPLNAATYILSLPVMIIAAATSRPEKALYPILSRRFATAYYSVIFGVLLISASSIFGLFSAPTWMLIAFNLGHGTVAGVVMLAILLSALHRSWRGHLTAQFDHAHATALLAQHTQKLEQKSRFLQMLSHELNTPLSVVSLVLTMPKRNAADTAMARDAARNMKAILERCLFEDRQENSEIRPKPTPVALRQLLVQLVEARPNPKKQVIDMSDCSEHYVETDRQLLSIILRNLLDNAFKYADEDTPIRLHCVHEARNGREGVSITLANQPELGNWPDPVQLFTRYYRAPRSRLQSGTGLGLHLARGLAHNLEGELAYARQHQEATFTLWVPLCIG